MSDFIPDGGFDSGQGGNGSGYSHHVSAGDGGGSNHGHNHIGDAGGVSDLGQALGLGTGHNHGLLWHLLGLDQNHQHSTHFQGDPGSAGMTPSHTAIWTMALQSIKPSNWFQGMTVTPGGRWLMMFAGATAWLFVVHFIRHHEPLVNQAFGTGVRPQRTTIQDFSMMEELKRAQLMPAQRESNFYTPIPAQEQPYLEAARQSQLATQNQNLSAPQQVQQYPQQYSQQYLQQFPPQYPAQFSQQYPQQYPAQFPQQFSQPDDSSGSIVDWGKVTDPSLRDQSTRRMQVMTNR